MPAPATNRIGSLDLLKGVAMVIMAIDHVRDYFHYAMFFFDPSDPAVTTWPVYLTRFVTHFCAPAFSFLAGLSAFLVGRRKNKHALSVFLLKRGFWLIFVEIIIMSFGWRFDPLFRFIQLQTIWQLGISMLVLAALIHLPLKIIIAFSCVTIFGHNLLDKVDAGSNIPWAFFHGSSTFSYAQGYYLRISYPFIPWVAIMSLGYCFGPLYNDSCNPIKRKKILGRAGSGLLLLYLLIILVNRYGDPVPWKNYGNVSSTVMSMLNITKYPPSLKFLSVTLGCTLLFLANAEKMQGRVVNFFSVFGRVPFFYYILHVYLIHLLALFAAAASGFDWRNMILTNMLAKTTLLKGYGFGLWVVYAVWAVVVLGLYPLCKKFDQYKQNHKDKWWLSYL